MAAASEKLQRCTIFNGGYGAALDFAGIGDVVYCDPPYLGSAHGESFTAYTDGGFDLTEHETLLEACTRAVSRGAHVLISNRDTPEVRALYRGWRLVEASAWRSVGSRADSPRVVREVLAILPTVEHRALPSPC